MVKDLVFTKVIFENDGQTIAEYGLLTMLIAVPIIIAALPLIGPPLSALYNTIYAAVAAL